MITKELLQFIEAELALGQKEEHLIHILHDGGWTKEDIDEALHSMKRPSGPISIAEMKARESASVPELQQHVAADPLAHVTLPPTLPPSQQPAPVPLHEGIHQAPMQHGVHVDHMPNTVKVANPEPDFHTFTPSPAIPPEIPVVAPQPMQTPVIAPIALAEVHATAIPQAAAPAPLVKGQSLREGGSRTRRMILQLLVAVVLLGGLGIGAYGLMKHFAVGATDKTFATMYAAIPGVQSLRYSGETKFDFTGEVVDPIKSGYQAGYTGTAHVALKYDGKVDFGHGSDGTHQFGITAELKSGGYDIAVNSNVEVRVIGDTYYLKITNPPELKDIDLSRLKTYWIALTPSDIAKRIGSTKAASEGYGAFGTGTSTNNIRALIAKNMPFTETRLVGEESILGSETTHYQFKADAPKLLALLSSLVESLKGAPPVLSAEEQTNVLSLLSSISGDVWVDKATFLPRKLIINQPIAGTVTGIKATGRLDSEQTYTEYNSQVSVDAPRPVMTYDEFADDIDRQVTRMKATGDDRRILDAEDIQSALELYRANHDDHYPVSLDDLAASGLVPSIPADPDGPAYLYVAFAGKTKLTKKDHCTGNASSTCAFYHLGVTLEHASAEVLSGDADLIDDVMKGGDQKGCLGEVGKACYDLTPDAPVSTLKAR